jgi:hypothetical protein
MWLNMAEVKAANKLAGQYWFSPATMQFFDSKIETELINGKYFITSEQGPHQLARHYTIRVVNDDATIDTVGEFQAYSSLSVAQWNLRMIIEDQT